MKATSGTHYEMWAYETTNNSFWQVTNLQSSSAAGGPHELTVQGNIIFFSADDGTSGDELWAHNTINKTTWQVIDLNQGSGNANLLEMHLHSGNLYFSADDGSTGHELWRLIFSRQVTFV